jgi:hypothetical protein
MTMTTEPESELHLTVDNRDGGYTPPTGLAFYPDGEASWPPPPRGADAIRMAADFERGMRNLVTSPGVSPDDAREAAAGLMRMADEQFATGGYVSGPKPGDPPLVPDYGCTLQLPRFGLVPTDPQGYVVLTAVVNEVTGQFVKFDPPRRILGEELPGAYATYQRQFIDEWNAEHPDRTIDPDRSGT